VVCRLPGRYRRAAQGVGNPAGHRGFRPPARPAALRAERGLTARARLVRVGVMTRTPGPRPIQDVAAGLELTPSQLVPYGLDKAKISLEALGAGRRPGKLVLVSAITPTAAGEGKTTTSIGLA